jgi:hypothetical protein
MTGTLLSVAVMPDSDPASMTSWIAGRACDHGRFLEPLLG